MKKMIMMIWTIGRAGALPFRENIEDMEATKFFRTSNVRKKVAIKILYDIIKLSKEKENTKMYNKEYDLSDLNSMRASLIYEAISRLVNSAEKGVAYTPRQLSALTGGRISSTTFEKCLARGYHAVEKKKKDGPRTPYCKDNSKYWLFGYWNAECSIRREGVKVITVKEYDEQGNLVNEYQRRRGRPYYTATF